MRRPLVLLAALTAACGGRTAAPSTGATPAPAAPAAAAAPRDPATLRYAPGTARYKVESSFHSVTEMMGNSQVADGSVVQFISVSLTQQGENLAADFTIDSVSVTGQSPGQGDPTVLRGKVFHAVLAPNGKTISVTVPDTTNLMLVSAADGVRDFFPALPPSPVSVGQTWTDTASATQRQPGITVNSRSVRAHRVVGWEGQGAARALRVTTSSAITLSGEGEAQGQAIQLAGTGTGSIERLITAAGAFQMQNGSDSTNINVTVLSMGLEIPVRQSRRSSITRLP